MVDEQRNTKSPLWSRTVSGEQWARGGVLVAGVGIVALLGVTLHGRAGDSQAVESGPGSHYSRGPIGAGVVPPGVPCMDAAHGEARELIAAAKIPAFLPSDGAAAVTDGWTCGDPGFPVLMLDNVQLTFDTGPSGDPASALEGLAKDAGGFVTQIQGYPAYVSPDSPNHQVTIIRDTETINLLSTGDVPISRLLSVAESLNLKEPALVN